MLVGTADTADLFAADMGTMGMQPMTVAEAIAMVPVLNPDVITSAGFHGETYDIDTDRLIQDFARVIRRNGRVATGSRVAAIARTGDGWAVTVENGEVFEAWVLVNAAAPGRIRWRASPASRRWG